MRAIVIIVALSSALAAMQMGGAFARQVSLQQILLSRMAPADEYFGRQKESVLEIRNRLDAFDRQTDSDMQQRGTIHALNDLGNCIRDWERKYPRDPWLHPALDRLRRDYRRAEGVTADNAG